jgi:hypothetical protein
MNPVTNGKGPEPKPQALRERPPERNLKPFTAPWQAL